MYPNALCSTGAFRDSGAGAGAELDNFWKRWVRVRRDSAIKKLLKIFLFNFLYIFTIKIFLKNTLLCLDSQKKKKEEGKFRLFRPYSRPISAVSGKFRPFPACFGRRSIRPDMADTARFWPNQPGSTRIVADSAWIEPHQRELSRVGANLRKKKKNANANRRAGNHVGCRIPRRTRVQHLWCRFRAF